MSSLDTLGFWTGLVTAAYQVWAEAAVSLGAGWAG